MWSPCWYYWWQEVWRLSGHQLHDTLTKFHKNPSNDFNVNRPDRHTYTLTQYTIHLSIVMKLGQEANYVRLKTVHSLVHSNDDKLPKHRGWQMFNACQQQTEFDPLSIMTKHWQQYQHTQLPNINVQSAVYLSRIGGSRIRNSPRGSAIWANAGILPRITLRQPSFTFLPLPHLLTSLAIDVRYEGWPARRA